jgi:endonuclease/exonuclease/phosphatase (EEP) superfamily protein YafD
VTRVLALYPALIAALLIGLPILAARSGPLALATILSVHLALAALLLVPLAIARRGVVLRSSLAVLGVVAALRFGGEFLSLPPSEDPTDDLFEAASWNLEIRARSGAEAVDAIATLDIDIVALQELGPEHAAAITGSARLAERYPAQELYPDSGFIGIGLLSRHPILRAEHADDPSVLEAVVDVGGQEITVITAHPLPGRIRTAGPVPVGFDPGGRDGALRRVRARIDAAIGRGETVVVLGDFNVAPTEPAFGELVDGLRDAHAEIGQGPGWTWRPSSLEWTGLGLLRIDLALSSQDLPPVRVAERCGDVGDHCLLEASFSLAGARAGPVD